MKERRACRGVYQTAAVNIVMRGSNSLIHLLLPALVFTFLLSLVQPAKAQFKPRWISSGIGGGSLALPLHSDELVGATSFFLYKWNRDTGELLIRAAVPAGGSKLSQNGSYCYADSSEFTACSTSGDIFDLHSPTASHYWQDVYIGAISFDEQQAVLVMTNRRLRVLDLNNGEIISDLPPRAQRVITAVAMTPDGKNIIYCSNSTCRVVRIADGVQIATFSPGNSVITKMSFSNDGKWMLAIAGDSFSLTRLSDFSTIYQGLQDGSQETAASIASDSQSVVWLSNSDVMRYYISTGEIQRVGSIPRGRGYASIVDAGRHLAFFIAKGLIAFDLNTGHIQWSHPSYDAALITPDGKTIIASGATGDKLDVATGKVVYSNPLLDNEHKITSDSRFILEEGVYRKIISLGRIVDVNINDVTTRSVRTLMVPGLGLSNDGRKLKFEYNAGRIIYDASSQEVVATLPFAQYPSLSANFDLAATNDYESLTYVTIPELSIFRRFRLPKEFGSQLQFLGRSDRFVSYYRSALDLVTGAQFSIFDVYTEHPNPQFLSDDGKLWISGTRSTEFNSVVGGRNLGISEIYYSNAISISADDAATTILFAFTDGSLVAMDNPLDSTVQSLTLFGAAAKLIRNARVTIYDSTTPQKLFDHMVSFDVKQRCNIVYDGPFAQRNVFVKPQGYTSLGFLQAPCTDYAMGFFAEFRGDVDDDDEITTDDLLQVYAAIGTKEGDYNWTPNADIDLDGKVSSSDVTRLAQNFGVVGEHKKYLYN